ncbi:MAG: hypothetical protein ACI9TI_000685 [Natronomonas sp.]|jgi:hypothetical protein
MPSYRLECDDRLARRIEALATTYGMTEEKVLTQLVEVGLEELDGETPRRNG